MSGEDGSGAVVEHSLIQVKLARRSSLKQFTVGAVVFAVWGLATSEVAGWAE